MRLTVFEKIRARYELEGFKSRRSHFQTTLSLLHNSFCHNSCISVKKYLKIIYYILKKLNKMILQNLVV
jgi:hypothetical protein